MQWDTILWDAEVSEEDNEIRLSIEGTCSDIDERTFRQLKRDGVEVKTVKLSPERHRTETTRSFQ